MRIATIGFFDGVHKGHRYLFRQLDRIGAERGLQPLIITFEEHPRVTLQSDYVPQLLTTPSERKALLSAFGEVLMLPFASVQSLTAAQFMALLHNDYDVSVLLMGYDHRFGSDRLKNPREYSKAGAQTGVEVLTTGEFVEGELHVSSTEIRMALESGNIAVANELLGRPYSVRGEVVHGKGIGSQIGFPTANIRPEEARQILPHRGVYAVSVRTAAFTWRPAILNIGINPTVSLQPWQSSGSPLSIEVHIPSFDGNLYGEHMDVRFERFIR
jgi:riboflavin kinase/FMN adenylyltransferase